MNFGMTGKPKYGKNSKLCYMDGNSIAEDVVTIFCTSNFELDTPFPEKINKNVIGLMKDEWVGKIIK